MEIMLNISQEVQNFICSEIKSSVRELLEH